MPQQAAQPSNANSTSDSAADTIDAPTFGAAIDETRAPTSGLWSALRLALADIKLAHTVFAMPFALLGAAIAWTPGTYAATDLALALALVIAAMVFARTWAMLVNRLADWRYDRENARTARRAVASGRLGVRQGWAIASASAAAFVATAALFWIALGNAWPLLLAAPVLAWIALYSYTKRFTALAHFFLGSALAISPICAALAVRPQAFGLHPAITAAAHADHASSQWTSSATATIFLAGFVALWVAGFDIAYALQDLAFDRQRGLRSIPAKLGQRGALWVSRAAHLAALALLTAAAATEPRFGPLFAAAVAAVAALLLCEHLVLTRRGLDGLPLAFFTINGLVSCLLGLLGVIDIAR